MRKDGVAHSDVPLQDFHRINKCEALHEAGNRIADEKWLKAGLCVCVCVSGELLNAKTFAILIGKPRIPVPKMVETTAQHRVSACRQGGYTY